MQSTKRRLLRLTGLLAALSMTATACGQDPVSSGGSGISGTINVSGSSTVAPITTRVAEQFAEVEPGVEVNVDGPGTGDGFKLFCDDETDISNASRAIKREEAAACAAKGIEYVELKVAIDGLTVMTNPANNAVTCLNFADLYALAGPESQGRGTWSDAQELATELGSKTQLPNAELDMAAPGEESGTYDSFIELALQKIADQRAAEGKITKDQAKTTRPDYQSSGDDNIIIQGIEGSKSSFGWVGFAYAEETGGEVKEIAIARDAGTDCVEPTVDTIAAGKYPLARNLYLYVNAGKAKSNPAIPAFVDFFLGDGIRSVTEVNYVALSPADLETTKQVWATRTLGTRDGGK